MLEPENPNLSKYLALDVDAQDIRSTDQWKTTEEWFMQLYEPSFGRVSNAEDPCASPDGLKLAFTATIMTSLYEPPHQRIYLVNTSGQPSTPQAITHGPHTDKLPKWSPNGAMLAFLSDRHQKGHFRLYALNTERLGEAQLLTTQPLDGVIEDFEWSPNGDSLLFRLAAYGLPKSGFEGSGSLVASDRVIPEWMPSVKSKAPPSKYRTLWLYDMHQKHAHQVSRQNTYIWRFCWAGTHHAFAVVTKSPTEDGSEEALVMQIDLSDGSETILRQRDHLSIGRLVSTPSGSHVAFIEAISGDRTKIVGNVVLINSSTLERTLLLANDVDIESLEWIAKDRLLVMGLRNLDSVAIELNVFTKEVRELWSTHAACSTRTFAQPSVIPNRGFSVVCNAWKMAPEIGLVNMEGTYHQISSFDHGGAKWLRDQLMDIKMISWKAPDGLDIYGLLYLPVSAIKSRHKTIVYVHGGPFSAFKDQWLGYTRYVPWLVTHGYAVFCPNPRGSVGRGAHFTAALRGDVGGIDASDIMSGIDHLVDTGVADPARLGILGGSYGGYMACWLPTQTTRFKAAVSSSPITDYKLQLLSGSSREDVLGEGIYGKDSLTDRRSPLLHVQDCHTPTLLIVGSKDICVPPAMAHYYHAALLDLGIESVIVEYPQEGHGVRSFPSVIDAYSRVLGWFDRLL
ncbi:Alpha/Beta hydrolase protein [Trichoderma velutinum]